jgi:hypothetical protein
MSSRYQRVVYVKPWFISSDDPSGTILALEIDDFELVCILREIVHNIYKSLTQAEKDLPLFEQQCQHTLHLEYLQSTLPTLRTTMMTRNLRQLNQYTEAAKTDNRRSTGPYASAVSQANVARPFRFEWHPTISADQYLPSNSPWWTSSDVEPKTMPFTLPTTMSRRHLKEMYQGTKFWWWTFKSHGQRMLWYSLTVAHQPLSVWLNRIGTCWAVPNTNMPADFHDGTVWDGELTRLDDGTVSYLIFDCLVGKGRVCAHLPQRARITIPQVAIRLWEKHDPSDDRLKRPHPPMNKMLYVAEHWVNDFFVVRVKRLYPTWDVPHLLEEMTRCDHEMDGILAMTDEDPLCQGGSPHILKLKMDHTLDFQFRIQGSWFTPPGWKEPGIWFSLWTYDTDRRRWMEWKRQGQTFVPQSLAHELRISDVRALDRKIVECRRIPRPTGLGSSAKASSSTPLPKFFWRPFLVRSGEKFRPNNLKTVEKGESICDDPLRLSEAIPLSYLLGVMHLQGVDLLSDSLSRMALSILPQEADTGNMKPLVDSLSDDLAQLSLTTSASISSTDHPPIDAKNGFIKQQKSNRDLNHLPYAPGWRILEARDRLWASCRTTQDFVTAWRAPVSFTKALRLPAPTHFGPTSFEQLLEQHRILCASWSGKCREYSLLRS